jgi:hypothetical protein
LRDRLTRFALLATLLLLAAFVPSPTSPVSS